MIDDADELDTPRADKKVDEACEALRKLFAANPRRTFYSTQLETHLERTFFHWITGKSLRQLSSAGEVKRTSLTVQGNSVRFYAHPRHRYWSRQQKTMARLLAMIFDPAFARALGDHAELMFDAALGRHGFRTEAQDATEWEGRRWQKTGHDLDRIIVRDGFAYGVEIKNTQGYIPQTELFSKLQMCRHLSLTPLFVMRFAPKSYIYEIQRRGGFALLFEHQIYPLGYDRLIEAVKRDLGLKVSSPKRVPEGHIDRFLRWHSHRPSQVTRIQGETPTPP